MQSHPDITSFERVHCGISGGKDSTALLLWLVNESGLPYDRLDVTFCDTGNEDPFTYAFIELLQREVFPIDTIRPQRDFWELARHKKRFPSTKARFCTQFLKVIPTRAHVRSLLEAHSVLVLNGVRRSEGHNSNNRARAEEWEYAWEDWGTWVHRPIVDKSIEWVWEMHKKYLKLDDVLRIVYGDPTMSDERKAELVDKMIARGIPDNPLYTMGASRVGCFPCVMSRKGEVRSMNFWRPERIDYIEAKELEVGEANSSGISTFFPRGYIPLRLNSKTVTIKDKDYTVPTIRDVVDWSKTARGGKQYDMELDDAPASTCDIGGLCE